LNLRNLSPNTIGVINRRNGCVTTLLKKGLIEKPSNEVVGVIKWSNGRGFTITGLRLWHNPFQKKLEQNIVQVWSSEETVVILNSMKRQALTCKIELHRNIEHGINGKNMQNQDSKKL